MDAKIDPPEEETLYKEFMQDLLTAHIAAQKALDALYKRDGPKRSILFRVMLGRAQSILIGLYVQELERNGKRAKD